MNSRNYNDNYNSSLKECSLFDNKYNTKVNLMLSNIKEEILMKLHNQLL